MQNCSSNLFAVLSGSTTDLLDGDLFEFYAPTETDLCPANAEKRFAATDLVWMGWTYEQQAISHGDTQRFIGKQFDNVSVTLSNIDRTVAAWIASVEDRLEGYRLLIRAISRSVDDDSIGMGVYRCDPVGTIKNQLVQISAKQDLGSIVNELPFGRESETCPLEFKGPRCLAGQSLGSKSAEYQAAIVCNKSRTQCREYVNEPAFQGEWLMGVSGKFKVSQPRGGAGGAFLALLGSRNKRVTKQYSSRDESPIGTAIPLVLGAAQVETIPLQSADTGQYLAGQWAVCAGEIQKIQNPHNITSGWANVFQAYSEHLGKFGFDSSQIPLGFFATGDQRHSQKAYIEATIKGNNPDTGDPAPSLVARVLGIKIPAWNGTMFGADAWSDAGVDHARFLITEERSLNYNPIWIDDVASGETAEYCNEPVKDQTGGEDVYVSNSAGTPGTDYKLYRSSGILDRYYFRYVLGLSAEHSAVREVTYNTFNPASPPTPTPTVYYRKRFTSNFSIREPIKTVDFIYDNLLPAFRGYLIGSAQGKLQIKTEKPTVSSYIRNDISIAATAIPIEDALAWRGLNLPIIFALVGAGLATSETRVVSSIAFSTAGNSITLSATGSATASGATLSGGTSEIQAQGTVTVGSAANASVTIEGVTLSYAVNGDDTSGTVAAMLAVMINADLTLNRFVKASWTPTLPNQVIIRSKLGLLNVPALQFAHDAAELCAHVHMVFSDVAFGALTRGNILQDGYEWPLGSKNTSFNKFTMSFQSAPDDYKLIPVEDDDFAHQRKVNKKNVKEVGGGGCIDNYNQARRCVVAERYKFREGNYFGQISTDDRRAMLLEQGDVICVTHSNQPGQRNLMMRIEELRTSDRHRVVMQARLYSDDQFPQSADERTIGLITGIGWPTAAPGPVTSLVLISDHPFAIHGTFAFAAFVGGQLAKVEVERFGTTGFVDTGLRIAPDVDGNGTFDLSSLPAGYTSVRITPIATATNIEGATTSNSVIVMDDTDYIIDLNEAGTDLELVLDDDGASVLYE